MAAQPIRTPPSAEYGQAKALADAQRAVPLAQTPPVPAAPAPSAPAAVGPYPGEVTPLDAPTQRPNEPLTHGLPVGPGAGTEVLGAMAPVDTLGTLLRQAAAGEGSSPEVKALAQWVGGQPR